MKSLNELMEYHGSDKAVRYCRNAGHGYTRIYEPLFEPLRFEPITLLELGWGGYTDNPDGTLKTLPDGTPDFSNPTLGGRSIAAFREYFPKAVIGCVDIEPKVNTVTGTHLYQGSQDDPWLLERIHNDLGDFDIVIDDASHDAERTATSREILQPWLKPGGYYIIEDIAIQPAILDQLTQLAHNITIRQSQNESITFHHDLVIIQRS